MARRGQHGLSDSQKRDLWARWKLHHKKEYEDIPVIVISGPAGSYVAVSKSVPVIEKPPDEEEVVREVAKALGEPL